MGNVVKQVTIQRGLRATFMKAWNNNEDPKDVMPYILETTSDGPDEDYGWLGQSPSMSEWIDERKIKSLNDFEYSIPNKPYEATIGVDRDSWDDDRMGAVKTRVQELARKARVHPRKLFFDALEAGTVALCYDGQPLFSNSHEEGDSGVQDNLLVGTGTTLAQLKADVEAAEAVMLSFKDDTGEPYNEGEVQIGIICHPGLKARFEELNTSKQISSSDNSMKGKIKQLTYSSRLTDANDWYIADVSNGLKPFIKQLRKAVEFEELGKGTTGHFMSKKMYFGVDYRVGFGYGLWQKICKIVNT